MSGLFDSLTAASNALGAHRMGIDVAGQNLANINTEGYSRRSLLLAEVPSSDFLNAGRGVEIVEVRALRDLFVEARIRQEQQGASFDEGVLDHLSRLETVVGLPGAGLDAELTKFFDAFSAFANDVTSAPARDGVVRQGQQLAVAFNNLAGRFDEARRVADQELRAGVVALNDLASRVATLNAKISTGGPGVQTLEDQRGVLLGQMAELGNIAVLPRADGGVDVTIGAGRALVIGENQYALDVTNSPGGYAQVGYSDFDVTSEITGGKVGGLLRVRDVIVPGYTTDLDQMAFDIATAVNAVHAAGFDASGAAAGNFFAAPLAVTGAAAGLQVEAAVVADSALVAGSATGAAGDNQTARAIAGLRDASVMSGATATPSEAWARLIYRVGSDVASARVSATSRDEVIRQLGQLRSQTSGVSVDEEAANLMRFQRAYEANARYFTTIVDTIDVLMRMV